MLSIRVGARAFASLLGCIALVVACNSNNDSVSKAVLSAGCLIDSDCASPLVCAFKSCHEQCTVGDAGASTPDCPSGELCVASDRPYHVCQAISTCTLNSDCPAPLICGRDLECRDQCATSRDCVSGQSCVDGTCVAAGDPHLLDGGLVAPDAGLTTAASQNVPCTYASDCTAPLVCLAGFCGPQCKTDRDCSSGLGCVASVCVALPLDAGAPPVLDAGIDATLAQDAAPIDAYVSPILTTIPDGAPDGYAKSCVLNSDCPSGLQCKYAECVYECNADADCDTSLGYCCGSVHTCVAGNECVVLHADASAGDAAANDAATQDAAHEAGAACATDYDCSDGVFCDGVERCVQGHCQSGVAACDDADPCTTDTCTESSKSCAHVATGPIDADGDGHFAASCGNGADDCDDNNPQVYPGHPEVCDYVDNNCNGQIDEGAWTPGAVISLTSSYGYFDTAAPPVATLLPDGSFMVFMWPSGSGVAWKVPASLSPVPTGVPVSAQDYSTSQGGSAIATDGTHFVFPGYYAGTVSVGFTATDLTANTRVNVASSGITPGPSVIWLPWQSQFYAAWVDSHLGSDTLYSATVSPTGTVGTAHQLFTTAAQGYFNGHIYLQVTPNNTVFVAGTYQTTGHARWAIFDSTFTTPVWGPFDTTESDSVVVFESFVDGSQIGLVATDANGGNARVRLIDSASGNVTSVAALPTINGAQLVDPQVAPLNGGYVTTQAYGSTIQYGWSSTIGPPSGVTQFGSSVGDAVGGIAIVPVDKGHVFLTWPDRTSATLKAMIVTCGN